MNWLLRISTFAVGRTESIITLFYLHLQVTQVVKEGEIEKTSEKFCIFAHNWQNKLSAREETNAFGCGRDANNCRIVK